jgi:site-specific DNA recombinase
MSESNSTKLTPAVAYLRKSTRGTREAGKRAKQEKSLAQQKQEILKLARGRFNVLKWFEDEGVSGWKRGAARPDFTNMLREVKELGARAVLCDALDRFSRATYLDVEEDARSLVRAGVSSIVTASQGEYAVGTNEIGDIIKFAAAVWAAHDFSRTLARRVSLARRNAAEEGKRTGGREAYGLADDGKGGYEAGDPEKGEVVVWLFTQFADEARSLSWLAGDLNRRGVPGPRGGKWLTRTVARLLRRRCYRGDFEYGKVPCGHFYRLDAGGEVVERKGGEKAEGRVFRKECTYKSLVDPTLFDRAQQRLGALGKDRGRRKRAGYALSGVLRCDHCGSTLYGLTSREGHVLYRCNGTSQHGAGACGYRAVREDVILPLVTKLLGEEVGNVLELLSHPPDDVARLGNKAADRAARAQAERVALAVKIDRAMRARIESDDARTRKDYDRLISEWRDQLDRLDADLAPDPSPATGDEQVREYARKLCEWFRGDNDASVPVPAPGDLPLAVHMFRMARDPQGRLVQPQAVLVNARKLNEALHRLGCEVSLRWEDCGGGARVRHLLTRGRFRLGQKSGDLGLGHGVLAPSACRAPRGAGSARRPGNSRPDRPGGARRKR